MELNKSAAFSLIHLLNGAVSAAKIGERMPTVTLRSVQRALIRLTEAGLIERHGITDPRYSLNYGQILQQPVKTSLLEDINRPSSAFNFSLLEWLLQTGGQNLPAVFPAADGLSIGTKKMTKRELEYLTIELSWKSSALEGNTYNLLDTELLLTQGVRAKNKTSFETQMVLNHKTAIDFITEHPELFTGEIVFSTVEEMHRHISRNLDIEPGIRRRPVRITASNYEPLSTPVKLRECADSILSAISSQQNIFIRALLAFSFMPYLQPFEDGNKRIGRLLANAVLIHSAGRGFSLKNTDARQLALAYLSFYEFNSLRGLAEILRDGLRE